MIVSPYAKSWLLSQAVPKVNETLARPINRLLVWMNDRCGGIDEQ
jgi:hypothetical protein